MRHLTVKIEMYLYVSVKTNCRIFKELTQPLGAAACHEYCDLANRNRATHDTP
jgi:hypothetical protein